MHLQAPHHGPRSRRCPRIRSAERLRPLGLATSKPISPGRGQVEKEQTRDGRASTGSGEMAGDEYPLDRLDLAELGSMPPSGDYQAGLGASGWRMDNGGARAD